MNAKENALRIIRFDKPERVVMEPPEFGISYYGSNHDGFEGGGHESPVGTHWTDIWGTVWHKEHPGVMGFPRGNPLAEVDSLRTYKWPSPDDERICGQICREVQGFAAAGGRENLFLTGSHRDTLWEKSYMLAGMENMMVNFRLEPNFVREVFHRIMDFQLGIAKHYLAAGIDMAWMSDDMGTQSGPLLGEQIVREFLMPEYRRLFDLYRSKGVLVMFHSCGHIHEMLPIFMELGVDILNPVQATANDLDYVRRATSPATSVTPGRSMAILGAVSTKTIMDGPVEAIEAEVRQRLWQLGRDGGYFCCADQGMPFPPGHAEALKRAVERYGVYPLSEAAPN